MLRPLLITAASLVLLAGCADSHEKVHRDYLEALQNISWMFDDINNRAQWKRCELEREGLRGQLEGIRNRQRKLGEAAGEEARRAKEASAARARELLDQLEAHRGRLEFTEFGTEVKAYLASLPGLE